MDMWSFAGALVLILLVLKIIGYIHVSWWIVVLPLILVSVIAIIGLGIAAWVLAWLAKLSRRNE